MLDDALLAEAVRLTGARTKRELVHEALRTLVATRRRRSLLDLKGKIRFSRGFDHKSLREARP